MHFLCAEDCRNHDLSERARAADGLWRAYCTEVFHVMRCCGILPPPKNHSCSSKIWVYVGKWVTQAEVRGGAERSLDITSEMEPQPTATHRGSPLLRSPVYNGHLVQSVPGKKEGLLAFHTLTPCRKAGVGPEFHPSLTTTLTSREHKHAHQGRLSF